MMPCDAKRKKQTRKLVGGESPDVTDDTTNKGLRPRNPPNTKEEGNRVELLDTTNKRFLLRINTFEVEVPKETRL